MSALLHNIIQIEDNKYSILFANQIKEELIIYNKEREQGIQEIVKERKNEIQKLNTFLLCAPNYDTKSLILLRKNNHHLKTLLL